MGFSTATPADFQEHLGPPTFLESNCPRPVAQPSPPWMTRPSPSSSAERSPIRDLVSISLRLQVITDCFLVVLASSLIYLTG